MAPIKEMKEMPLHFLLEWNTWNAYTIFLHRSQIFTTPNTPTPLLTENVDIIVKGNRQWLHTNIKIRHNHGEPSCPRQPVQKLHIYACITSCAITPQHVFSQSENIRKYDNYPKIWWVFIIVPIKIAIWGIDTSPISHSYVLISRKSCERTNNGHSAGNPTLSMIFKEELVQTIPWFQHIPIKKVHNFRSEKGGWMGFNGILHDNLQSQQ